MSELRDLMVRTAHEIADYREGAAQGRVFPDLDVAELRATFGGPLPVHGTPPARVIDDLVTAATPGLVATTGPRYFGFVIGGALASATAADLLAAGWDQPAYNAVSAPAAAVVEEVSGAWLKELLGIPASASFGFVTGAQAANTVGLAAARHHVLRRVGYDVERDGLVGAPRTRVIASVERHATIDRSLRLLGFGSALVEEVAADANGAIDVERLAETLATALHRVDHPIGGRVAVGGRARPELHQHLVEHDIVDHLDTISRAEQIRESLCPRTAAVDELGDARGSELAQRGPRG